MSSSSNNSSTGTVAVVGLGKIGLPLAAQFAGKGWKVIGCDVLQDVVDSINDGRAHIHEEPGLEEAVAKAVKDGKLKATRDTSDAVRASDVAVIIVPLMVGPDHSVDYRNLDAATKAVGKGLKKGSLVIAETTLPVGTTRQRLLPALESESGLRAGRELFLAFSPERLYAGRIFADLKKYPKIVGGVDAASTEKAVEFYRSVLDAEVWAVDNAETAEFTKLAETTYRDVNIALANQLALYGASRDADVNQAFKAANSQPFSHIHRQSIGVGGHCIPVYPQFLLADATEDELSLVRDGRRTNDRMAEIGVQRLDEALGGLRGKKVLVLGASYREDVKELAFSTAISLVDLLQRGGAEVLVSDPLFRPEELRPLEAEVVDVDSKDARGVDAVIVQAWHREYRGLDWGRFDHLKAVLDGRESLDPAQVTKTGAAYIAIGLRETRGARSPK